MLQTFVLVLVLESNRAGVVEFQNSKLQIANSKSALPVIRGRCPNLLFAICYLLFWIADQSRSPSDHSWSQSRKRWDELSPGLRSCFRGIEPFRGFEPVGDVINLFIERVISDIDR
jgi:hypothetical protein